MDISGTREHHLMLVVSARTPLLRETTAPHCHAGGWSVAGDWTTNCSWRGGEDLAIQKEMGHKWV